MEPPPQVRHYRRRDYLVRLSLPSQSRLMKAKLDSTKEPSHVEDVIARLGVGEIHTMGR